MRDQSFRALSVYTAECSSPAFAWPYELLNAMVCYFVVISIVKESFSVAPTVAETRDMDPHETAHHWEDYFGPHQRPLPQTSIAVDVTKSNGERLTNAQQVLMDYLTRRDMFEGWDNFPEPNFHVSHLDILTEYMRQIYEIYNDDLHVVQCRQRGDLGVIGQVTIYEGCDGAVMQGIITCPFFSTFNRRKQLNLSVADKLVEKVKQMNITPSVLPVASNNVWRKRVESLAREGTVILVKERDTFSYSEANTDSSDEQKS